MKGMKGRGEGEVFVQGHGPEQHVLYRVHDAILYLSWSIIIMGITVITYPYLAERKTAILFVALDDGDVKI